MLISNTQRELLVLEIASKSADWSLSALISFAEEKLAEENHWPRSTTPPGNIYNWTIEELLQYVYDRYSEEVDRYSEDTLLELLDLNKPEDKASDSR